MNWWRHFGGVFLGLGALAGVAAESSMSPPLPPLPVSPVATFRQLLALPEAERAGVVAARFPQNEAEVRARLAAYDGLSPEDREVRLQATDLYWHMQHLLRRVPGERERLLEAAPADLRPILVQRLQVWDALPEADRQALLEQERAIRYFARMRRSPEPPLPPGHGLTAGPSVSLRAQSEFARQTTGPMGGGERLRGVWRQLFEGPPARGDRLLSGADEAERREMDAVLQRFRRLSPAQRQVCIESFTRFATMAPAERAAFLRDAERWEALPPEERAAWRRLVPKLPPLPPLPSLPRTNLPPLPPAPHRLGAVTPPQG